MILYYFKTARNNIIKSFKSSAINIIGLAIGITTFFILGLYVHYENSYDDFLENADNIYRVQFNRYQNGDLQFRKAMSVYAIGPLMKENIPEVEGYARGGYEKCLIYRNKNRFNDQELLWADSSFLDVIPLEIIAGNKKNALKEPYTTIISETSAKNYFGNEDPIGKPVYLNEHLPFEVKAVFKDIPQNSHMNFKLFVSLSTGNDCERWPNLCGWGDRNRSWGGASWLYTYVKLKKGTDYKDIENKMAKLVEENLPARFKNNNIRFEFLLQPIKDIHLNSALQNELKPNESKKNVLIIFVVGIVVMLIAWLNFINISSFEAFEKAKQIGIRKVVGASKKSILTQYIFETFLQNLISAIIAIILVLLFLPLFNTITNKPFVEYLFQNPYILLIFPFLIVLGTFFSGIIPSILMASFNPVKVIKGKLFTGKEKFTARKILVQFQLIASIILIISVLAVYKQISFMQSRDLGYDKDFVLVAAAPRSLNMDTTKYAKFKLLRERTIANPSITEVTSTLRGMGMELLNNYNVNMINGNPIPEVSLVLNVIDNNFVNVYGSEINSGTNYEENLALNRNKVIINETAARKMGFDNPHEAIGQYISSNNNNSNKIIGVMKDIYQESLHKDLKPTIYFNGHPRIFGCYAFKISSTNIKKEVNYIEKEWYTLYPHDPFDYVFLDNYINDLYKSEVKFGRILMLFTILAIFITSLGLLGIILISTKKNIKQIGIRKVNGAKHIDVLSFCIKDYVVSNIIALIIGIPVGYLLMDNWLGNFAYKTELVWWIFIASGAISLIISFLTVSWQSLLAAGKNPVEALRYE